MDPASGAGEPRDYRSRGFYRRLYTENGFQLILLAWRLLGKTGAGIISRAIGLGYALTHPATTRAIRSNIALLEPRDATFAAACRLLMNQAECLSAYGRLAAIPPGEVMNLLGHKQGFEHLKQAHEAGKGCLLVTGHLGFFELGGLVMTELGFPMTALTLPEPSPELTKWRADFRARWGVRTIVVGDDAFSVVEIARALREGSFVAMLADRPYNPGNAIPVECPHGHILFSTGPALISLLAGCPVIPVGVTTEADGKFRIEAGRPIETRWLPGTREETIARYTREIAANLLPMFARDPEQWYHFAPLECDPQAPSENPPA